MAVVDDDDDDDDDDVGVVDDDASLPSGAEEDVDDIATSVVASLGAGIA